MAGGTVGVVRQWDIDYMVLTDGSVPFANVPTIAFSKNGVGIASQSGLNLIEGTGVTITAANDPTNSRVNYTINSAGGSPAGSNTNVQFNNSGSFGGTNDFVFNKTSKLFKVGDVSGTRNSTYLDLRDHYATVDIFGMQVTTPASTTTPIFTGSGLDDLSTSGTFSGLTTITYTITVSATGTPDSFDWTDTNGGSGTNVPMSTSPTILSNGVEISFGSDTGHTLTDNWTFEGIPELVQKGGQMFALDGINRTFQLGDIGNIGNGTKISINDSAQTIAFDANGNTAYSSDIPLFIKVTVPSADLLAVVTGPTPYQLIPAPGAGKFIDVISIVCNLNFNTTAYDFNNALRIGTNTTGSTLIGTDGGQLTISPYNMINASATKLSVAGSANAEKNVNTALYLNAGTATTVTTGDSDIDLYITYKIVTL